MRLDELIRLLARIELRLQGQQRRCSLPGLDDGDEVAVDGRQCTHHHADNGSRQQVIVFRIWKFLEEGAGEGGGGELSRGAFLRNIFIDRLAKDLTSALADGGQDE